MRNIEDILLWKFNSDKFAKSGKSIIRKNTKKRINDSILKLHGLSNNLSDKYDSSPDNKSINEIVVKFKKNANLEFNELESSFSRRDIRLLTWGLDINIGPNSYSILFSDDLKIALRLIDGKWRDTLIIVFWKIILKNWSGIQRDSASRSLMFKFFESKCKSYTKSRNDIKSIISDIDFFVRSNSPEAFAKFLFETNLTPDKSHELLGQRSTSILAYDYFSAVIEIYTKYLLDDIKRINEEKLIGIYNFLEIQKSKKTKLIICSRLINEISNSLLLDKIKRYSIKLISDPVYKFEWIHNTLTAQEEKEVSNARRKLNLLLNKKLINTFFEKLVQDKRRKKYWLSFVKNIDDIKFVGNILNYNLLDSIDDINVNLEIRYLITKNNLHTSAMLIYSKDYVFVEFSDTGALQIIKEENFNVNLKEISSLEKLKIWPTNMYASKNSNVKNKIICAPEGRIAHIGKWEKRINAWMKKYYD